MKVLGEGAMEIRRDDERRMTVTMERNVSFKFNYLYLDYNSHFIEEKSERENRLDVKIGVETVVPRSGSRGVSS